ncbi:hypothetical protein ACWEOZ_43360 [Actinoplanes sp. NPDC004185]
MGPATGAEALSLTGAHSHRLVRSPGVGSLTMGPARPGRPRPDLVVSPADRLDWTVFDPFTVPDGGPWPRWLHYEGDDTGFAEWTRTRPTEGFAWTPHAAHDLDLSGTVIQHLSVTLTGAPVRLVLPDREYGTFTAYGNLPALSVSTGAEARCPALHFCPRTLADPAAGPVGLPVFPALAAARSVDVTVGPVRQPFDCASLLQFPEVRRLALSGRLANLPALAGLRHLTGLQLRFSPDLAGLPALTTWPELEHVIAWNVDAVTGRRLRGELRPEFRDSSVSKLRTAQWFATEYGLPFAAWPARTARAATKAYRAAEQAIAAGGDLEAAVRDFVRAVNKLPGIETGEREDSAAAVARLAGDHAEAARAWFDAERDF